MSRVCPSLSVLTTPPPSTRAPSCSLCVHPLGCFPPPPPCPSLALAFASPVQYVRTPRLRDKLVLHACVVSLWLHGFEMDISTLGKDFSLPPRKLVGFFRELGCSYRPTLGA